MLVTYRPGKLNLQRYGKVRSMRVTLHNAAGLWVLPSALCIPGKGFMIEYFLEVISSEVVISMVQYTQYTPEC